MKYFHLIMLFYCLNYYCVAQEKWKVVIVNDPRHDYWQRNTDLSELHIPFHEIVADFNGDSLLDRAYSNVTTSGTGGSGATIYLQRKDGKFACVGGLGFGRISVHPEKKGRAIIFTSWRFGGGDYSITKSRISFDGISTISEEGGNTSDPKWEAKMEDTFKTPFKIKSSITLTEDDLKTESVDPINPTKTDN